MKSAPGRDKAYAINDLDTSVFSSLDRRVRNYKHILPRFVACTVHSMMKYDTS